MKNTLAKLICALSFFGGASAFAQAPVVGNPIDRGPSLPVTCSVGQGLYFKTSAADGLGTVGIYACLSANTWTELGAGSGTGTVTGVLGTTNQVDVTNSTTQPVVSLDPAIILPGSIQFGTTTTSVINGCGGYSDFSIQHQNGTCNNYPAASSSTADEATAARTAIAALVNGDKLFYPCAEVGFAGTLPSYPANTVGVSILPNTDCPLGAVYRNGPAYTITNVVENSSNVVTLTVTVPSNNSLAIVANQIVHVAGLSTATWLNGLDVRTATGSGTTVVFTDPTGHGTASTSDSGTTTLEATLGGALWTANDNANTSPCLVDLSTSTNMQVEGLTLYDVGQSNYGCQLGATTSGGATAVTNFSGRNLTLIGSSDDIFIQGASASGICIQCSAFSQWDNTKIAVTTPQIIFRDGTFYTNGASTACDFARNSNISAQGGIGGATAGSGEIAFINQRMKSQSCSASSHSSTNYQITGGITVTVLGGTIENSGGTAPAVMVNSATGGHSAIFHLATNTIYPSGEIFGTANDDSSLIVPGGPVPQVIYSVPVTGMSMANSGTNTVLTGPTNMLPSTLTTGTYEISFEIIPTAQGVGGTCAAGTMAISLGFTDDDTGVTTAVGVAASNENVAFRALSASPATASLLVTYAAGVLGSTADIFVSFPMSLRVRTGTALSYQVFQVTNSNCSTTPPVFSVRPQLKYLGE